MLTDAQQHYRNIYSEQLAQEAEWLRFAAPLKAESVDVLTRIVQRPFASLCEFGCGTGAVLEQCVERKLAITYVAVDNSFEALQYLQNRLGDAAETRCCNLEDIRPQQSFEVGVISHVLEHLERPDAVLRNLSHGTCRYLVAEVPLFRIANIHYAVLAVPSGADRNVNSFDAGQCRTAMHA